MADPSPRILHLDHVGVVVTDLERSLAFYRDALGMPELERKSMPNGSQLVFLRMGAAGLIELLYKEGRDSGRHTPTGPRNAHCCLHVNSLDVWLKKLTEHGIALTSGPSEMELPSGKVRLCFFQDPDGIPVELYERANEV